MATSKRKFVISLTAALTVGLLATGASLWYLLFGYATATSKSLEARVSSYSSTLSEGSFRLASEPKALSGLPSETLTLAATPGGLAPSESASFVETLLKGYDLTNLVNVHLIKDSTDGFDNGGYKGTYDFFFYSSSLSDYQAPGPYTIAETQWNALLGLDASDLAFTSQPQSNGGRVVSISATTTDAYSPIKFRDAWTALVKAATDASATDENYVYDLSLTDSTGAVGLTATLSSADDITRALGLNNELWESFSTLLSSASYSFLEVQKLTFALERTSEASVLTVTTKDGVKDIPNLENQLWSTKGSANDVLLLPWSYITYFVTEDDPSPYLFIGSSSRLW